MSSATGLAAPDLAVARDSVTDRVLMLATAMVHWANNVRPNVDGSKVGGHQASCASSVHILCALMLETLTASDRIAIKPHASPVFHAIQYLLGNLDEEYLTRFRASGGLQSYPSRTKDPDGVDFSTGSVGLPGPAAAFAALTRDYLESKGLETTTGRIFAHIGDAELDEGTIWEAVADPSLEGLSRCVWVVDTNRQSLDRVIPGIRIQRFQTMLEVNGWTVVLAKYGGRLAELMALPGGHVLRQRMDAMSNEQYQALLVAPHGELRERLLADAGPARFDFARCIADVDDDDLADRIANLGGHDMDTLIGAYRTASLAPGPAAVFAYTVKGWGLQTAADPFNHAAVLTPEQFETLAARRGIDPQRPWGRLPNDSPAGRYLAEAAERLRRPDIPPEPPIQFNEVHLPSLRRSSTQDAFGRVLTEFDRASPQSSQRIVTASADVALSTSLGTWINNVAVWSRAGREDVLNLQERPLKWLERPDGRHIELGLSESNLMSLLGQLGVAESMSGRRLIPIGTVYDPFVSRGLDTLLNALQSGARFILAATPSGISLSSEGGAHQGVITPSLGVAIPSLTYYEPTFAKEVEWIMLDAVRRIGAGAGEAMLIRLSNKRVDQTLFPDVADEDALRQAVLAGCWRYRNAAPDAAAAIDIYAVGAMLPEALDALPLIQADGIDANIFVASSPDLLYRRTHAASGANPSVPVAWPDDPIGAIPEGDPSRPVITVIDGHPAAMAFMASAPRGRGRALGVESFGQSGARPDLYREHGIDAQSIYQAAVELVE